MNNPLTDKESTASALLGLAISRESSAYALPTDEELAMLLEEGVETSTALDATRKAQILDTIANDSEVYRRWMNLVESAESLKLCGFANEPSKPLTQSVGARISNWFTSTLNMSLKSFSTAGGGLIAASALMVIITTSHDYDSQLDALYDDYGSEWSSVPASKMPTRSVTSILKKKLSPEDSVLSTGVTSGLERLGENVTINNLNHSLTPFQNLDSDLQEGLKAAGEMLSLIHI